VFSRICGHEALLSTLATLVGKQGSFLFYGPPSVGKKMIANIIAQYDLCLDKKEESCTCKSCKIIQHGHPDLLQVGKGGKVLVEDVDELINFNSRAPFISSMKVAVVDSIENASPEAANRLLKILEESKFNFFLISSDLSRVLPTIASRCFKMKFESLSADEIATIMMKKFGFDALSSRTLGWIGSSMAIDIFSNAGTCLKVRDMVCDFISTIRDLLKSLEFVDRIEKANLPLFCDLVVSVLTDVLLLKNGIDDIINADRRDVLQKVSKTLNDKAVVTSLGFLSQVKKDSHLNVNLGLAFKSTLIKVHPLLAGS
jgi:replication-associated recombination protein RarA